MRDQKDNATLELPGLINSEPAVAPPPVPPRTARPRNRRVPPCFEQLSLLEDTDATGLPVWRRDASLDLTGLPVWAPAQ